VLIRRIARPMLAAVFVAGGVDALRNPAPRVKAAAPLVAKGEQALPNDITDNVPTDPDTLVKVNAGVQIGGGLLLAVGKLPRLASLALAGSLVPTTLAGHAFWEESDPETKAAQRIHFLKNVSLAGGLLIAAVDTEGKPSVAWRTRKGAERAQQAVTAALPLVAAGSSSTTDSLRDAAHRASERGQVLAQRVAESDTTKRLAAGGTELAHTAAQRAQELAHQVAESDTTKRLAAGGTELAHTAAQRAQELAHQVAESDTTKRLAAGGQDFAHTAAQRSAALASDWADEGGRRGRKLAKKARKNADSWAVDAADRAQELAAVARTHAAELADEGGRRGRKLAKRARKEADRLSADAADRAQLLAADAQSRGQLLAAQARYKGQGLASSYR